MSRFTFYLSSNIYGTFENRTELTGKFDDCCKDTGPVSLSTASLHWRDKMQGYAYKLFCVRNLTMRTLTAICYHDRSTISHRRRNNWIHIYLARAKPRNVIWNLNDHLNIMWVNLLRFWWLSWHWPDSHGKIAILQFLYSPNLIASTSCALLGSAKCKRFCSICNSVRLIELVRMQLFLHSPTFDELLHLYRLWISQVIWKVHFLCSNKCARVLHKTFSFERKTFETIFSIFQYESFWKGLQLISKRLEKVA